MQNPQNPQGGTNREIHETVAQGVIQFAIELAIKSKELAKLLPKKVDRIILPVLSSEGLMEDKAKPQDCPPRSYPPLFEELYIHLLIIKASLHSIEFTISQIDL